MILELLLGRESIDFAVVHFLRHPPHRRSRSIVDRSDGEDACIAAMSLSQRAGSQLNISYD